MPLKIPLIAISVIAFCVGSYWVGYRNGERDNQKHALGFRLKESVSLYRKAERGDLSGLESSLGVIVFGRTKAFEEAFGEMTPEDDYASTLADAQRISSKVESNMVTLGTE